MGDTIGIGILILTNTKCKCFSQIFLGILRCFYLLASNQHSEVINILKPNYQRFGSMMLLSIKEDALL